MAIGVDKLLTDPGRQWARCPGASMEELNALVSRSPCPVPPSLVELLRFSNGGEGHLALPPRFFVLNSVAEIIDGLHDPRLTEDFSGFVFFGGNGGLERLALDRRSSTESLPVVMVDPIAGPESARQIAPDFPTFVAAIGLEYRGEQDDA